MGGVCVASRKTAPPRYGGHQKGPARPSPQLDPKLTGHPRRRNTVLFEVPYHLNVRREQPKTFADRVGIDWESGGASRNPAAKVRRAKPQSAAYTTPQSAAYSKDEPGDLNQKRGAGLSENRRAPLPETWSLPDDWRRQTLAEYIATSDAINRSSQRFHELKGRTPRTAAQWRNEWESWCLAERNFQHKPPAGGPSRRGVARRGPLLGRRGALGPAVGSRSKPVRLHRAASHP